MTEFISIRIAGEAGRITFDRPEALNAMTYEMCMAIDAALIEWADDDRVKLIVIDAKGDRAFCAGGDIAELYNTGRAGNFAFGRKFWADEYRMNARMFDFPKPVATFMQGYTMGGGVGVGCHGSHRVVGASSRIAMPECGIGLIPDVGGSLILARAPGRLGEYLGTTSTRMDAGDAIHAGFADYYIDEGDWPALIAELERSGDWEAIDRAAAPAPQSALAGLQPEIDLHFGGETLRDILNSLRADEGEFAADTLAKIAKNSPLSMACTVELVRRARARADDIRHALGQEYRFSWRAMEQGDLLEGIRAQIIDKDRTPKWQHDDPWDVGTAQAASMLLPLGRDALTFD